jgi:hypothetical protein
MHILLILIPLAILFPTAMRGLFAVVGWLLIGCARVAVVGPPGLAPVAAVALAAAVGRRRVAQIGLAANPISVSIVALHRPTGFFNNPVEARPDATVDLAWDPRQRVWRA